MIYNNDKYSLHHNLCCSDSYFLCLTDSGHSYYTVTAVLTYTDTADTVSPALSPFIPAGLGAIPTVYVTVHPQPMSCTYK